MSKNIFVRGSKAVNLIRHQLPIPIGRTSLYRLFDRADIPTLKLGRRHFVPLSEIHAAVEPFVGRQGPWLSLPNAYRIFSRRSHASLSGNAFRRYAKSELGACRFGGRLFVAWPDLNRVLDECTTMAKLAKLACLVCFVLLACQARAQHSVTLTWGAGGCPTDPSAGGYISCNGNMMLCNHVTGYRVYRSADASGMPASFALLGSTNGELTYTDTAVAANDTWWYAVTVLVDSPCESAYSNEIWTRVPPSSGDVMYFSAGKWIARTPTTPINVQSTPVAAPPSVGDVLMWFPGPAGSSRWMPRTPVTPVARTMAGQILVWNGSAWAPKTPAPPVKKK
jgi:hypothetical protein